MEGLVKSFAFCDFVSVLCIATANFGKSTQTDIIMHAKFCLLCTLYAEIVVVFYFTSLLHNYSTVFMSDSNMFCYTVLT